MNDLARLFRPASIALVGASPDATKLAGRPLAYLRRYGYQGTIHPVNPRHTQIDGVPCSASIGDLPRGIDLALILLPAAGVAQALADCAAQGVATAISIAGGFAEAGAPAEQQRLTTLCKTQGIRLIGPNCVGLLHPALGVTATFSSELRNAMPRPGQVALFTQSGALGNALLQSFNDLGLGLAYWVSTGNEADLGVLDLMAYAIDDDGVRVIALYVEGFQDGERLLDLSRRARAAGKIVVVLRAGRSQLGRTAAVSHTGKLAGAWKVWRDVAAQAGLVTVNHLDELLDVVAAVDRFGLPGHDAAPGLGVLTISGGLGVLISDSAADVDLPIPPFADHTQDSLRAILPPQMTVANPVDTALFTDEQGYARCAEAVLHDPAIGTLLLVLTRLAHDYQALLPWLERVAADAVAMGKHLALTFLSSSDPLLAADRRRLMAAGALVLPTAERVVAALGRRALGVRPLPVGPPRGVGGPATLPSATAADFLRQAGVPLLPERVCTGLEEALDFASRQGYPVVLKVVSPDIAHKSELGGVRLNLTEASSLADAWGRMQADMARLAPAAAIAGYSVQPMLADGFELIVGCSIDPELGRVLMVGSGGVWAEVLDDVRFLALPTSPHEIAHALQSLRMAPVLRGARGQPVLDIDAAVAVIDGLARQFQVDRWVAEVDLNPLLVRARGKGVMALDVLVVPGTGVAP